jgi:hypothetical protein
MTLSLDHQQRLNLIAVLGSADFTGREQHAVWHLQDSLDLDEAEKQAICFRWQAVNGNGNQLPVWDADKSLPAREFEISEADLRRIRKAIDEFPQFQSRRDRVWLEPLCAQLEKGNQLKE